MCLKEYDKDITSFRNQEWTERSGKSNLHAEETIVGRNRTHRKKLRRMEVVLLNSFELLQILLRIFAGLDEEEVRESTLEETIKSILSLQE